MSITADFVYSHSTVPQDASVSWQDRFQPPGGNMTTSVYEHGVFIDLGAGIEPRWPVGDSWESGLPVSYSFTLIGEGENDFLTKKRAVAHTTVNWWDEVSLLEVELEKENPLSAFPRQAFTENFNWPLSCIKLS